MSECTINSKRIHILIAGAQSFRGAGGWGCDEVKNADLLQEFAKLVKVHAVRMQWVPFRSKDRSFYRNLWGARLAAKQAGWA